MHIPAYSLCLGFYVLLLEFDSRLVGVGYDEQVEIQGHDGDQSRGEYVRDHHPVEADSAGEDGDDLGIRGHLGREEDHRDEHEQRTEHVHEVRHEVDIIVEDDGLQRRFLAYEIVDLLADVEDDDDADDQNQRHEEGAYEFPDYVQVKLSWSEVELHLSKVLSLSCARSHPSMP